MQKISANYPVADSDYTGNFCLSNKSPFLNNGGNFIGKNVRKPFLGFAGRHANGNLPSQERAFMLSVQKQEKLKKNQEKLTPEDKRNLVGFFALLIKVDKRINPHLYKNQREKND